MIFTCDNCHFTFEADSLPAFCPDCHKEKLNRRAGRKIIEASAVREATEQETGWYEDYRLEKESEEYCKSSIANLNHSGMTDDEYNWALVMIFKKPAPRTEEARQITEFHFREIFSDPEKILEYYLNVRREFTRDITANRNKLREAGQSEPISISEFNDDGELVKSEDIDDYGPALSVLYHFRLDDIRSFLHTPSLGDLRKINLKKIAEEPSAAYAQFLWDLILHE